MNPRLRSVALAACASLAVSCGPRPGPRITQIDEPMRDGHVQAGRASWYGPGFHGRKTASGEVYDMHELTAAHRTAPFGAVAMVTNKDNGRSVRVRINDRGPFIDGRVIDLSRAAADAIGMLGSGTAPVEVRFSETEIARSSFFVQIGAFKVADNAMRLLDSLRQAHPKLVFFLNEYEADGEQLYRVRSGPFDSRGQAERALKLLHATQQHRLYIMQERGATVVP